MVAFQSEPLNVVWGHPVTFTAVGKSDIETAVPQCAYENGFQALMELEKLFCKPSIHVGLLFCACGSFLVWLYFGCLILQKNVEF